MQTDGEPLQLKISADWAAVLAAKVSAIAAARPSRWNRQ